MERVASGESVLKRPRSAGVRTQAEDSVKPRVNPSRRNAAWRWCGECVCEADASCSQDHPVALMDHVAALATLQSRMVYAKEALMKAKHTVLDLQDAMDELQDTLDARSDQLLLSFEGDWDSFERGIQSGEAAVALAAPRRLPAEVRGRLCAALAGTQLGLTSVRDMRLTGWCDLPADLVAEYFPLRPEGRNIKPGAVLHGDGKLVIYLRRLNTKKAVKGERLLGFVQPAGLDALAVDYQGCEGRCPTKCIFCQEEGPAITVKKTTFL